MASGGSHPVTPVAKTGLHCGKYCTDGFRRLASRDPGREDRAPLRRSRLLQRRADQRQVTPVAKTGLHCGNARRRAITSAHFTGDPGREDRAPLRLVVADDRPVWQDPGDPGREDRAPLRQRGPPGAPDRRVEVTPVAKTGLHCGQRPADSQKWMRRCDPGREDRAPLRPRVPARRGDRPSA